PTDWSSTVVRRLGPSVTFTALLRMSTPRSMRSRASTPNLTSLADIMISVFNCSDHKDGATGRSSLGMDLNLRPSSFETPAAPTSQDKENWLALTQPFSW